CFWHVLISFDYFDDLKYFVLNFLGLSKQKLLEIIFVLYYLPYSFHINKGNLKVTIFKKRCLIRISSRRECFTTSRIKTVRAGARDCPQDNPLSKRAQNFDSRLN